MVHAGSLTAKLEKQETFTETMKDLNGFLTTRVFFATNYFTLADVFLYSTLYLPVSKLNKQGRLSFCHVTRYFDLVQHLCHEAGTVKLTELVDIDLNAPPDEKPLAQEKKKEKAEAADGKAAKKADKGAAASSAQAKPAESSKKETKKEGRKDATPAADADKKEKKAAPPDGKAAPEKAEKKKAEKAPEAAPAPPEGTPEPERFDMRVGYIISAKRHPQADTLYVEEVDLGEPTPRTVVSGLVKWMPETELQGRKVVLLCNLKPAKMRGIESQAMVLAATAADGSCVELLDAPEGSKPGDRCWFDNHIGTDFSQLNPKKKIFETVQPHLKTDSMKRAVYVVEVAGVRHLNVLRCDSGEITVRTVVGGSIK
ncbi:nucleic acid-binding protein [Zopfochytrium polystomum]|nr:nucleic acid-binding protein [Zopfochytrium polystomum]